MTLTLLGNYAQTGHFGGPLAYTPYNVALHLAGPDAGGLRYDYRRPKHPFADRFLLAGGHNIPTGYALWMIMGEALARRRAATGDDRYYADPKQGLLSIDCLGFRRGAGALATLLADHGLTDDPLFAQAKLRGIRALAGHAETTDVTNDVNGGPSGIGIGSSAGKAAFWDFVGAPSSLKVMALEGEIRHDRRPCPGAEDAGGRPAGGQAAAHPAVLQQRRHRRPAAGRRGAGRHGRVRHRRTMGILRVERPGRWTTPTATTKSSPRCAPWSSGMPTTGAR